MSDVVYRSEVRIERVKGPVRRAYLPARKASESMTRSHGKTLDHASNQELGVYLLWLRCPMAPETFPSRS
jgi:hypothetical protein